MKLFKRKDSSKQSKNQKQEKKKKIIRIIKGNSPEVVLDGSNQSNNAVRDFLIGRYDPTVTGNQVLGKSEASRFSKICSPVFTAIDIISQELGNIKPATKEKCTEKWTKDGKEIIELLCKPNGLDNWYSFITKLYSFLVIYGNCYILGQGRTSELPNTIFALNPTGVTVQSASGQTNDDFIGTPYPTSLFVSTTWGSFTFYPEKVGRHVRYIDKSGFYEIFHISNFQPDSDSFEEGLSALNSIYFEMQQYIDSSKHNISLLQRGIASDYIITTDMRPNQDDMDNMKEDVDNNYTGANNAGRPMFMWGEGLKIQTFGTNNKDMEFEMAQKRVSTSIYSALHIPLPLVSSDHMSLANYEASRLVLYDQAVLPMAKRLLSELSDFLIPRTDKKNLEISFNPKNIPALESRKITQVKSMRDSNVFSGNEIRGFFGYDKGSSGLDKIYMPANMLPIANDTMDNENGFEFDENKAPEEKDTDETELERFKHNLKAQKNKDGVALFTDEEIDKLTKKFINERRK